jgi:hypothetical protein
MSSQDGEDDVGADTQHIVAKSPNHAGEQDIAGGSTCDIDSDSEPDSFSRTKSPDALESGSVSPTRGLNGTSFQGYTRIVKENGEVEEDAPGPAGLRQLEMGVERERVVSPDDSASTMETPDDTPSIQVNSICNTQRQQV